MNDKGLLLKDRVDAKAEALEHARLHSHGFSANQLVWAIFQKKSGSWPGIVLNYAQWKGDKLLKTSDPEKFWIFWVTMTKRDLFSQVHPMNISDFCGEFQTRSKTTNRGARFSDCCKLAVSLLEEVYGVDVLSKYLKSKDLSKFKGFTVDVKHAMWERFRCEDVANVSVDLSETTNKEVIELTTPENLKAPESSFLADRRNMWSVLSIDEDCDENCLYSAELLNKWIDKLNQPKQVDLMDDKRKPLRALDDNVRGNAIYDFESTLTQVKRSLSPYYKNLRSPFPENKDVNALLNNLPDENIFDKFGLEDASPSSDPDFELSDFFRESADFDKYYFPGDDSCLTVSDPNDSDWFTEFIEALTKNNNDGTSSASKASKIDFVPRQIHWVDSRDPNLPKDLKYHRCEMPSNLADIAANYLDDDGYHIKKF